MKLHSPFISVLAFTKTCPYLVGINMCISIKFDEEKSPCNVELR